jgi:hypothetical protein
MQETVAARASNIFVEATTQRQPLRHNTSTFLTAKSVDEIATRAFGGTRQ